MKTHAHYLFFFCFIIFLSFCLSQFFPSLVFWLFSHYFILSLIFPFPIIFSFFCLFCFCRIAKDPRFERLPCTHKGTYADDCLVQRVTQVICFNVHLSVHVIECQCSPYDKNHSMFRNRLLSQHTFWFVIAVRLQV